MSTYPVPDGTQHNFSETEVNSLGLPNKKSSNTGKKKVCFLVPVMAYRAWVSEGDGARLSPPNLAREQVGGRGGAHRAENTGFKTHCITKAG